MGPNVLLLMIDALRADRCWGAERKCVTPVLDELVNRSTVFTQAFSTNSVTTVCTASLLTGSYPFVHGIRALSDRRLHPDMPTLAETFKANGYHTWAETSGPLVATTGLDRGFADYQHRDYKEWMDTSWGDYLLAKLNRGLPEPWFGFVHLWELHHPRRITAEYNKPKFGQTPYDRAVSSLDRQLGRLLKALPSDTLLLITGDHGEYVSKAKRGNVVARLKQPFKWLRKHAPGRRELRKISLAMFKTLDRLGHRKNDFYFDWLGHGYHVYDYLVHVPIIAHGPQFFPEGLKVSTITSHVDVFPTLVSVLELREADLSWTSGIDLAPLLNQSNGNFHDRSVYMEASGGRTTLRSEQWLAGLRTKDHKFIRGIVNEDLPEELYDLNADPDEEINLINQRPDIAETMRAQLTTLMQSAPQLQEETTVTFLSDEREQLQQHLRSLGYLD